MQQTIAKKFFVSEIIASEMVSLIVSVKKRILFIGSQCLNKESRYLACQKQRRFWTELTWQWSLNIIKMLWCRFQQCFGTFTMLLVKGSSETILFRHWSDHVLGVRNLGNTKSMRVIFFFEYSKFFIDFKNSAKNWEKVLCFWDNCISIGIVKLSLLRRGYFSSAANVLRSSHKMAWQ